MNFYWNLEREESLHQLGCGAGAKSAQISTHHPWQMCWQRSIFAGRCRGRRHHCTNLNEELVKKAASNLHCKLFTEVQREWYSGIEILHSSAREEMLGCKKTGGRKGVQDSLDKQKRCKRLIIQITHFCRDDIKVVIVDLKLLLNDGVRDQFAAQQGNHRLRSIIPRDTLSLSPQAGEEEICSFNLWFFWWVEMSCKSLPVAMPFWMVMAKTSVFFDRLLRK